MPRGRSSPCFRLSSTTLRYIHCVTPLCLNQYLFLAAKATLRFVFCILPMMDAGSSSNTIDLPVHPSAREHKRRRRFSVDYMELVLGFIAIVSCSSIAILTMTTLSDRLPKTPSELYRGAPTLLRPPKSQETKNKAFLFKGKEKFVDILKEMDMDPLSVDEDTWGQVPTWDVVEELYGSHPIVHGLESCQEYRDKVPAFDRRVGVAGMFNSGTNAIAILLQHNCQIPERVAKIGPRRGHGMEWQVPWGKHTPGQFRLEHTLKPGKPGTDAPKEHYLPVVSIRDPYEWMKSMCRHPYTARWPHRQCPNLVNDQKEPNQLTLTKMAGGKDIQYDSLAHLWNDWYRQYYSTADFPRLFVRFEDLIFYPKETTEIVCSCAGGVVVANHFGKVSPGKFEYLMQSAKAGPAHGKVEERTDLMMAWIKYGKERNFGSFRKEDLDFAREALDKEMMATFRYSNATL